MTTTTLTPAPTTSPPPAQQETNPKRRLFTVEEILAMDRAGIFHPEERFELLDGEIVVMPPIGEPHADGTTRLGSDLIYQLHDLALVRIQCPVRINDNSLLEPDIAVLRPRDDYHLTHPSPADVFLLIEVSDRTLMSDREVKLPRYAAAGIPEVWIANVPARQVEAYSDPVDGVYQSRRVIAADGSVSPLAFPDAVLTVGDFLLG